MGPQTGLQNRGPNFWAPGKVGPKFGVQFWDQIWAKIWVPNSDHAGVAFFFDFQEVPHGCRIFVFFFVLLQTSNPPTFQLRFVGGPSFVGSMAMFSQIANLIFVLLMLKAFRIPNDSIPSLHLILFSALIGFCFRWIP